MNDFRIERYTAPEHEALVPELTGILHEAYGTLASKGMRYWASFQTVEDTKQRLGQGESYLAFLESELAGTINLRGPEEAGESLFYRRAGVYSFRQFAVKPSLQGKRIGAKLLDFAEARARDLGATHLALDTSEKADALIALYTRRGYSFQEQVQWDLVNYRSVILAKPL